VDDLELAGYQDRVYTERTALVEKIERLTAFLASEKMLSLDPADQALLLAQRLLMQGYSQILDARIKRFTSKETPDAT